jgi:cell division inhibitor SepF
MVRVIERMKDWLFADDEEETVEFQEEGPADLPRRKKTPLISLHSSRSEEIHIRKPSCQDDAPVCADCLRARRPVIVNLKALDTQQARRVFDFLKGVVYALEGHIEEAGEGIFLLTPRNVDIMADQERRREVQQDFWQEN